MPIRDRVTVDVDRKPGWQLRAAKAYYNLRALDAVERVAITVSSGLGFHLVGECDQALGTETVETVRKTLADDPNRVRMDETRSLDADSHTTYDLGGMTLQFSGHPDQVLWSDKGRRAGEADRDFDDLWDAVEHVEAQTRSDYDRIKRLANDGHRAITDLHPQGVGHTDQVDGL